MQRPVARRGLFRRELLLLTSHPLQTCAVRTVHCARVREAKVTDVSSHAIRRCGASAFLSGRFLGRHELRIVSMLLSKAGSP
jgi:hypothetical protein